MSILTPVEEEDGESKVDTNEIVKEGSKISLDALNNEATATSNNSLNGIPSELIGNDAHASLYCSAAIRLNKICKQYFDHYNMCCQ